MWGSGVPSFFIRGRKLLFGVPRLCGFCPYVRVSLEQPIRVQRPVKGPSTALDEINQQIFQLHVVRNPAREVLVTIKLVNHLEKDENWFSNGGE
ncbi:uncharacterized protein LOC125501934 isoform X3 [Athalia rosae]|uniref:uncharacterized protein LOC125501934 isoform X3 n=1 Tax=Athalia rosae TaxID=37344 RepID=UPI0020345E7A|nr:uncharacterized protein LOC125501934 isoform X3 [Athalia rosae]